MKIQTIPAAKYKTPMPFAYSTQALQAVRSDALCANTSAGTTSVSKKRNAMSFKKGIHHVS